MIKKDLLIKTILTKELKGISKLLKEQKDQIDEIKKNGFSKEIHKKNRDLIWTGLHYTQGYCTAHIWMTKKFISLLNLKDAKAVEDLIKVNKKIEKLNKAEMKRIFDGLKSTTKSKENKPNDNKKKNKTKMA